MRRATIRRFPRPWRWRRASLARPGSTLARRRAQQHLAAFERHALRHRQDQPITLGGAHEGERDPRVPEVGSTSTVPGLIRPAASAAAIIETPMRSLTESNGLKNSHLARISALAPASFARRWMRTRRGRPDRVGDAVHRPGPRNSAALLPWSWSRYPSALALCWFAGDVGRLCRFRPANSNLEIGVFGGAAGDAGPARATTKLNPGSASRAASSSLLEVEPQGAARSDDRARCRPGRRSDLPRSRARATCARYRRGMMRRSLTGDVYNRRLASDPEKDLVRTSS